MADEGGVTPLDFLHQQRSAISGFLQSLEAACQRCKGDKEGQSQAVLESEGRRAVLFLEQQADEWRSQLQLEVSSMLASRSLPESPPTSAVQQALAGCFRGHGSLRSVKAQRSQPIACYRASVEKISCKSANRQTPLAILTRHDCRALGQPARMLTPHLLHLPRAYEKGVSRSSSCKLHVAACYKHTYCHAVSKAKQSPPDVAVSCRMAALGAKPALGGQMVLPTLTPDQHSKLAAKRASVAEASGGVS